MKYRIGDEDVELEPTGAVITPGADRLYVQTASGTKTAVVVRDGAATLISYDGRQYRVEPVSRSRAGVDAVASGDLTAMIPGTVVAVLVAEGDAVSKGATLLVVEAMKTQQPFLAPFDGTVVKLPFAVGETVSEGALLARVEP